MKSEPEPFYIDENGKKQDAALHADMLVGNPEADVAFSEGAIKRAVAEGMPRERAEELFGIRRSA